MTAQDKISPRRRGRPSKKENPDEGPVRSLNRALTLLQTVSQTPTGVSLGDLAARLELAPSTAHRLLKGLEAMQFVSHDEERGLWFVGVAAFSVGSAFLRGRDFVTIARPFMRTAMETGQESVNLAIRDGNFALYLSQVECNQMMRALATPGGRAPLHASGVGKALVMGLPVEEQEKMTSYLQYPMMTEHTLPNAKALLENLEQARINRYCTDDEEHAVGLRCAASPIFNEFGEPVAAISISGPLARIPSERLRDLGDMIAETAAAVTAALGGRSPY